MGRPIRRADSGGADRRLIRIFEKTTLTVSNMRRGTYLFVLPWGLRGAGPEGKGGIGGVGKVFDELYTRFDRSEEFEPRVLTLDWSAHEATDSVGPSGERVTRLRVRAPFGTGWLPYELLRYAFAMPGEMRRLRALIRRHDVRVANFHYIGTPAIAWVLAKTIGVFRGKVVFSLHGQDIRTIAAARGARRMLWRRALEAADAIVACSRDLAEETVASFGLTGRNVVTIHNGVDADRLQELTTAGASTAQAEVRRPHLVNLGTFEHKKGHDLLLRAFVAVRKRFPTAHLTIVGRTAGALDATRALRTELGLEDSVTFVIDATHEQALAILSDADLFVLPSRNEAFAVAMLEAGAMGRPVVAAAVCGVQELVEEHVTGVLVPPENVDALADGIIELLSDSPKAAEYGQALRRRVLEEFTADASFRKYLALVRPNGRD